WANLGVDEPGVFGDIAFCSPRNPTSGDGAVVADVTSRPAAGLNIYGWPPYEFIRQGLLRFCFSEEEDTRTQVGFIEQRVRLQLARWAWPVVGEPGAAILCNPEAD